MEIEGAVDKGRHEVASGRGTVWGMEWRSGTTMSEVFGSGQYGYSI